MSLNHIVLMGRLTKDPELRHTQGGTPVASFTIAVDRDYVPKGQEKQTDFIDCVAWGKGGENISKYFHRGSLICVDGNLQSRKWEDRDGNKRTNWEVNVNRGYFCEKKDDSYPKMDGRPQQSYQVYEEVYDDDSIPF